MQDELDITSDSEKVSFSPGIESTPEPEVTKKGVPGTPFGLWVGLGILIVPLLVYLATLCPTVFVGDAGDFLTAAFTLGVPHPPGYPLYTILGHGFMQLPIPGGLSSPAYRMNMMSAFMAWGAIIFMFLFLRRILRVEWAALIGALTLAFSKTFWEHAEIAEVYTLQVLFITLMFYLAVLYVQEKKVGWALLLAFIMGLAITHQYAVLIFYPGILIFIGLNGGLKLRWYSWVAAVLLAIIGLTPYLYLPLVKYKTPLGDVIFVESFEEAVEQPLDKVPVLDSPYVYFWKYFTRKLYSESRVYTHSEEALQERTTTSMVFKKFLETTNEDFGIPLISFGILGWIALLFSLGRKRRTSDDDDDGPAIPRAAFLLPALGYILYFLVVHFYPSGDILSAPLENINVVIPPLLLPLMCSFAAIIGLGFDTSVRWVAAYVKSQGAGKIETSQKFKAFAGLLLIAAFGLICVNAYRNSEFADKSQAVISYNYALNVLDSCDPNAILITTGDETFLFWYVQSCEPSSDPDDPGPGYRKDVWATNWIHNIPELSLLSDESVAMTIVTERFIASSTYYLHYLNACLIPLIQPSHGERPLNTTFVTSSYADSEFIMGLDVILQGLTYSFRRPGDTPDPDTPGIHPRPNLDPVEEGAAPLSVIDFFDSRPFENYNKGGLPRFEGFKDDILTLQEAEYFRVNLEAQELEVLARYQDSFYRFGIQALLEDTQESREQAVSFLVKCVSLDPYGWFGWKELGDTLFASGRIGSAAEMYDQLILISNNTDDVPPSMVAGAYGQLAHILLIQGSHLEGEAREAILLEIENKANKALILNPEERIALAMLDEVARIRSGESGTGTTDESDDEESVESEIQSPDEGLTEFDD